jgi:hypothetical protein
MFQTGDTVNGLYLVVDHVGEGGMGVVLKVRNQAGDFLALKYCADPEPEQRRRFAREVRVMQGISHPNVMPVVDADLSHDPPYFVMPLAVGSLQAELDLRGPDEKKALRDTRELSEGVAAIHAAGATHRDIKPLNVLRMADGSLRVADLGLAKFNERDTTILTRTSMSLGTFVYAAPEQFLPGGTRDADARTDVFQIGKTLYQLLTGDLPQLIDSRKIDPGLAHIVQRATRNDPAERYSSVQELVEALTAYELTLDPFAHPTDAFHALIKEARELAAEGRYDATNLQKIVELVSRLAGNSREILAMVEEVPRDLLGTLAASLPAEAERLVALYVTAVDDAIGGLNFEHAEVVARVMRTFFDSGRTPAIKALALEGTLIAGVRLNRWAAMEAFDVMLQKVSAGPDAVAVAEMLVRRLDEYRGVAERVPPANLHPAVRRVRARVAPGE